jgi:hypothetical protein
MEIGEVTLHPNGVAIVAPDGGNMWYPMIGIGNLPLATRDELQRRIDAGAEPRFMYTTVGNDPTSAGQFAPLSEMLSANSEDPDFCRFLERAQPGDSYVAGGGAAPEFTTWRVS